MKIKTEGAARKARQYKSLNLRDRLGYMSNTNANFEITGILLGQEARRRKM
ncbi:hypothetical protein [Candidatus Williamhamiltonella defendens]|uniref:hypothetical protein n=1 Tax=Candidatus Williamhamiltonella defendens TaxID=138072 RepID=UPI001874D482|nr:hypothetical protein [Candidatus Hamiltonella defensa]